MPSKVVAMLFGNDALAEARSKLASYESRVKPGNESLLEQLAELKKRAVADGDESLANANWSLEQIAHAQDHYLKAFGDARRRHFYSSWCQLELAEIRLVHLRRHFNDEDDTFGTAVLLKQIESLQELFPYRLFFSPGFAVHEARCSICDSIISLRSSCGHEAGNIYGGELCGRIITKTEALEISMVDNPVQKYSVGFPRGVPYNYALVDYVVQTIATPWTSWSRTIEKRNRPSTRLDSAAYRGLGRNDSCACGSGRKFKRCCLDELVETYDHHQFAFDLVRAHPPKEVPDAYVTGLDDKVFEHTGSGNKTAERDEILEFIAAGGRLAADRHDALR